MLRPTINVPSNSITLTPPDAQGQLSSTAGEREIAITSTNESGNADARTRTVRWTDPSLGATAAKEMAGLDYLQAIVRGDIARAPMAELMGYTLTEASHGRAVVEIDPGEQHYNQIGSVHAALASALLDSAMGSAVLSTLPAGTGYTTVELHVHLVRAISADTPRLRCIGEVVHSGSRMATAEARLLDPDGRLYAHATETCLLIRGIE
jgi:uncharacterized protein (TIGR00369 family)